MVLKKAAELRERLEAIKARKKQQASNPEVSVDSVENPVTTKKSPKPTKKLKEVKKKFTGGKKKAKKEIVRVNDRDLSDGLRPIERTIISKILLHDPDVAVVDIAVEMFGKDIKTEGPESIRTIRNGIRKPIAYGILEFTSRGRVGATKAYREKGLAASSYNKEGGKK